VTWPENCAPSGTTAVCSVPQVPTLGNDYKDQVRLTIRAADGAQAGAKGRVVLQPEGGNTSFPFDPNTGNNAAKVVVNATLTVSKPASPAEPHRHGSAACSAWAQL
jgi:hypothetical protein